MVLLRVRARAFLILAMVVEPGRLAVSPAVCRLFSLFAFIFHSGALARLSRRPKEKRMRSSLDQPSASADLLAHDLDIRMCKQRATVELQGGRAAVKGMSLPYEAIQYRVLFPSLSWCLPGAC